MHGQWGYVAISFIIGIAIACSSSVLLLMCCLVLYVIFCLYRTSRKTFLCCMIACFSGAMYTAYVQGQNKPLGESYEAIRGVIYNTPLIDGDRLSFQVEDQYKNIVQLSYKIKSASEKKQLRRLHAGASCVFEGERKEPPIARNFHGFNYRDYLYKQNIHFILEATYISECYKTSLSSVQWILLLRQQAISGVTEMFPEQSGAFMNALVFGDRQQMIYEVEEQYQQFGLVHLLAISGSHIVLLMVIVYFILLRSGVTREVATVCLIFCIPLYMILAGASPSVIRASITGVLMLIAFMCSIRLSSLDALSVTAICMLIFDPYLVFNIGFQFSFVGSFALLLSAPLLLESSNGVIRNSIYISFISQLVSTPILLYHFGYFSPYSIFLNILYVPFLSLIVLPCSIVILVCIPIIPFLAKGLANVLSIGLNLSNDFLSYCENLPFTRLNFGQTPILLVTLYCVSIISVLMVWERRMSKGIMCIASGIFLFISTCHYVYPYFREGGSVTFLDVGQGDAILIRLPYDKEVYLIDTGGTIRVNKEEWQQKKHEFSVGNDILIPYLQKEGIKKIDKLIVTHGDADHIGAAQELLSNIIVKEVVFGRKEQDAELEKVVKKQALEKEVKIREVGEGESWSINGAEFFVLAPTGKERGENNASIVVWAKLGGLTWLFTGDLEEEGEKFLVATYSELRADVLKVAHHGSNTSSITPFLSAVQPNMAIISAGERNRYGHPHKEVIERLEEMGIEIWRTDKQGAISYVFKGESGTFRSKITYDETHNR
ncbi:DNA internalization-related competence protein ComEC/Rec2 [Bacillus albus]|uniref:DNA internalization-related competence protein ComEC/Rec2 n=1 Tax=Bacillus albus TaxID=2026189 RepID=UPI00065BEEA1|nr:DNA internalization-related competence protein ComEC/Rec2 [Bacillus albus]KMP25164.1 competence protein ComEC [Bacillus cereus]RXJ19003.1 DNA internalization-related competence protein ComEC/Rec2 [Bacillus albus]RXJ28361.1 DNA internalization-related competence protein ComEC/Rec2 [Bacillus albus]RXJ33310.1 DNA internalization-related competence protein ComEC/Rec2 [Bacillus albus]RXJ40547.1 DNA internalization-related competence protein ComEC/Rec2 [Bacillus albus]